MDVSWTIKKAEYWRINVFELWCWIRFLRAPWTARRSNQSILKEINPENILEGQMLKLKLQYFAHFIWRAYSLEKTLMLGKIEGRRRRGQQKMRWLDSITSSNGHEFEQTLRDGEGQGSLACCSSSVMKNRTWLSDWLNNNIWPFSIVSGFNLPKLLESPEHWVIISFCSVNEVTFGKHLRMGAGYLGNQPCN